MFVYCSKCIRAMKQDLCTEMYDHLASCQFSQTHSMTHDVRYQYPIKLDDFPDSKRCRDNHTEHGWKEVLE